MSSKVFVTAICSSLPRILCPQTIRNLRSPSAANAFSYPPIKAITGFTDIKIGIRCMSTSGGDSKLLPAMPKSVPVQVAHELLQSGHRYLDVRTPEEFSAGHAVGAINVPFLFKAASEMIKNPNFLEGVSAHFSKEDEIVVGCQAGRRSLMAASDMISAGYTGVTDVAGGYSAWTQNGLPIES